MITPLDEPLDEPRHLPAAVSVTLLDRSGQVLAEQDPSCTHYAASLMKVPLAAAVLAWLSTNRLTPRHVVTLSRAYPSVVGAGEFVVPPEGADPEVRRSEQLTVQQLLLRMVAVSSNDATNVLFGLVGVDWLQLWLDRHCRGITITRPLYDTAATVLGLTNTVTSSGIARLLLDVAAGELNGGPPDHYLSWLLQCQQYGDMIAQAVPCTYTSSGKDGIASGAVHDARILTDDRNRRFVLVILTSGDDTDLDGRLASVRTIASALVPRMQAKPGSPSPEPPAR